MRHSASMSYLEKNVVSNIAQQWIILVILGSVVVSGLANVGLLGSAEHVVMSECDFPVCHLYNVHTFTLKYVAIWVFV